jgi:REP element-mobilizing transposase RayT
MSHKYGPNIHHRRSIRLPGYDYSQDGWYFITICAQNQKCMFGRFTNGQIKLCEYGYIVDKCWKWLAQQYDYVYLDQYVVMPNHLHGIIIIRRGDSRITPKQTTLTQIVPTINTQKCKPLSRLIGAFKTISTRRINNIRKTPASKLWQRNYYEHIIRNEEELNRIRQYIADNPANWQTDEENPDM